MPIAVLRWFDDLSSAIWCRSRVAALSFIIRPASTSVILLTNSSIPAPVKPEIPSAPGSRSPFDQVKAISDAVGDKLEIILDGGVRRGTHVLKALAAGAKACSFGKMFLFSLAAGGQKGVEHLLQNMHDEINRNMVLMGCKNLKELNSSKLIYRNRS